MRYSLRRNLLLVRMDIIVTGMFGNGFWKCHLIDFSRKQRWHIISYTNACFTLNTLNGFCFKVLQHLLRGSHTQKGQNPPSHLTGKSPAVMAAVPSKDTSLKNAAMTNLTLRELTRDSAQPRHLWLTISMSTRCMSSGSKPWMALVKANHPCLLT